YFQRADIILALDADFLACGAGHRGERGAVASRRHVAQGAANRALNRLYVVEGMPTITGAKADHRLPLRPSQVESFARAVAAALNVPAGPASGSPEHGVRPQWIRALADDLQASRGRSLVLSGEGQSPYVHALAHALNAALDNVGRTVTYTDSVEVRPSAAEHTLADLVRQMQAGFVRVLLILGANPAYSAPGDLPFADAMARVPLRAHLGLYADETAQLCHWHIPEAHFLESWGDIRAVDGTVTIQQPLIAPLYGGRSACELLAALTGQTERSAYDIVRAFWRERGFPNRGDFEAAWRPA